MDTPRQEMQEEHIQPIHLPVMAHFPILSHKSYHVTKNSTARAFAHRRKSNKMKVPTESSDNEDCNYRSAIGGAKTNQ